MIEEFRADEVAAEISGRLWRYLSTHSTPLQLDSVAESLFSLRRGELRRLTAAHLANSMGTEAMLESARAVLHDLPSSVTRSEIELRTALRPPVLWPKTLQRRAATGDTQRFVCRPPERAYDTALGRLVALALDRCLSLPQLAGLTDKGHVGQVISERASIARHLRGHAKLREVRSVQQLPERTMRSLQRHRHAGPLIHWVRQAAEALDDRSPRAIRVVVQQQLLPPSAIEDLFELFVGFRIIDALVSNGFAEEHPHLVPSRMVPFARLRRHHTTASVYWQRPLWALAENEGGQFKATLKQAGLSPSQLRPDFLIRLTNPDAIAFVEVKLTTRPNHSRDREGIRDALAYAYDAADFLSNHPYPHGLVVAWNSQGSPLPGQIMVSNQTSILSAMTVALKEWNVI